MTNQPLPHPGDATEAIRRKVRRDPQAFARELAEQHFNEALDMLIENARETLVDTIYDDLRMTIAPAGFEALLLEYEGHLSNLIKVTPTTLDAEEG